MTSAVIFDLDGTLVETEEIKALSHTRAVTQLNPKVSEEEVISAYADDLVGHSRQEVTETLINRFGLEDALRKCAGDTREDEEPWQALVRIRRGYYEELLKDSDRLLEKRYPRNIDILRELRGEGYPTACATMSHRWQVERVLSVLDLGAAFDMVVTMDDVGRGKLDPEIDLPATRELGVPPEEFLVVEDSAAGVQAAIAAGMSVVAVPDITRKGVRAADALDPRWVVDDPEKLSGVVHERIEKAERKRTGK